MLLAAQTDINDNMRAILIDWLVEVHYKFRVSSTPHFSALITLLCHPILFTSVSDATKARCFSFRAVNA